MTMPPEYGEAAGRVRVSARHFGDDVAAAAAAGLDGVEIGAGEATDALAVSDPAWRKQVKRQCQATGVAVSSLSMDLLNRNPVFSDPRGQAWLEQTIEAAADLGAIGILVPFFGEDSRLEAGGSLCAGRVSALAEVMKKVDPLAREAGVMLGLENTCSAEQNVAILEAVGCESVACYYDIGNSTYAGHDAGEDILALKDRICLIHFKDGGHFLGEGKVKMGPVAESLKAIGYDGWIVLETSCPTKNREADCQRNAEFVRTLMA